MRRIYPGEKISDARRPYTTGYLGEHPYPMDDPDLERRLREEKRRKNKENLPEQKLENDKKEKIVKKPEENPKENPQTSLF